jgi:hypothetical protein
VNESTLTENIPRFLIYGLLSSKKEVEAGYGEDSKGDGNITQDKSPDPLESVSAIRFKMGTFA